MQNFEETQPEQELYLVYLEHQKQQNEAHRELLRRDYLEYTENVKAAMIEIQQNATAGQERITFAASALNGLLAGGVNPDDITEVYALAWGLADGMMQYDTTQKAKSA